MNDATLRSTVHRIVADQPVTDMHTHCFAPRFGHSADGSGKGLLLWGIDELLIYHYLIAEVFRIVTPQSLPYDKFWQMGKAQQADHIWKHLFVERTPISEASRGVLTTLTKLGLDPNEKTLTPYRNWFAEQDAEAFVYRVMQLANIDSITMTNEVFDNHERQLWLESPSLGDDPRFRPALRIDPVLCDWPHASERLISWGYNVNPAMTGSSIEETKRFLRDWIDRMKPVYVAASLPPTFQYPVHPDEQTGNSANETALTQAVLPVLQERSLPLALMIGVRRGVNPRLRSASDISGKADTLAVANLCREYPDNRFMVTMLSLEIQHELCVIARKFGNLMPFGCWWFLNNPSIIESITRMRIELLGTSFIPQHSDARILDQLIYKWDHSRKVIADVLADSYAKTKEAGYNVTEDHIKRDVALLLSGNFRAFCESDSDLPHP
jgi:hypothetical protein